jgi:hypothetical protein
METMTLFLDTEFNGFGGELISIGIASDLGGEFYAERKLPKKLHPWVELNVVPALEGKPEADSTIRSRLTSFFADHREETLVADWPLDFAGLLSFMCVGDTRVGPSSLAMQLVPQEPLLSFIPHNALSDARALVDAWSGSARLNGLLRAGAAN